MKVKSASFSLFAAVMLSGALLLAGCGSSDDSSDSSPAPTQSQVQSGTAAAPTPAHAFYSSLNSLAASLEDSIYAGQDGDDTEIARLHGYAIQIEKKSQAYEQSTGAKSDAAKRLHAVAVAAYKAAKANNTTALARMHDVLATAQTKLAEEEPAG